MFARLFVLLLLFAASLYAHGGITPVVVSSEFDNRDWYPLPREQMQAAAVDTALASISASGRFAFVYSADQLDSGALTLRVSLLEPAESAKISIRLDLPGGRGSHVSTASVSLQGKDYMGIFQALQQLGRDGGEQLAAAFEQQDDSHPQTDLALRQQIIDLNLHVIKLGDGISRLQREQHDTGMREQLAKLTNIERKLDAQREYLEASDHEQNRKLDAILEEIGKLNIGSNTENRPPQSGELGDHDITQLPKIRQARELKYAKRFEQARGLLDGLMRDAGISAALRAAIDEELNVNLPLYEAEIVKHEVTGSFMDYVAGDAYKSKLAYINGLYDKVLARKDLSLATRTEVVRKKDALNITGDGMQTATMAMQRSSLNSLRMYLRMELSRSFMRAADGPCPERSALDHSMRQARVNMEIASLTAAAGGCELLLRAHDGTEYLFTMNDMEVEFSER